MGSGRTSTRFDSTTRSSRQRVLALLRRGRDAGRRRGSPRLHPPSRRGGGGRARRRGAGRAGPPVPPPARPGHLGAARPGCSTWTARIRPTAAQRELAEEADLAAAQWDQLVEVHTSPGYSDELIRIFLARGLSPVAAGDRHLREDEEAELTVHQVGLDEAVAMVFRGRDHQRPPPRSACSPPPAGRSDRTMTAVVATAAGCHDRPRSL